MRSWTVLILFASSGCLGQIIPEHQPAQQASPTPQPMPAGDDGGAAPAPAPDPTPPANSNGIDGGTQMVAPGAFFLEGESATLTAPMAQQTDANASGGYYIMVPAGGTGGLAVFTFNVPADADYAVWGRVIAPTTNNNSFHFSVDSNVIDNDATDGASTIWDLPVTTTWAFSRVNMRVAAGNTDLTVHLTAGPHTIYLNEREDQSALDRLIVTPDLNFVPN